jgi:diamine N-acetyltransferase
MILAFIPTLHPNCELISLTVEKHNHAAQALYRSLGFTPTGDANSYGELIYRLSI